MNYTENYQLNQWNMEDRIQMQDFNADNRKLDTALGEQAGRVAALERQTAVLGNCQLCTATYKGNGKYGVNNKNSLTFPHKPLLVLLCEAGRTVHLMNGCTTGYYHSGSSGFNSSVIWNGNTVSWSCSEGAIGQMNANDRTYFVLALLVKE